MMPAWTVVSGQQMCPISLCFTEINQVCLTVAVIARFDCDSVLIQDLCTDNLQNN